MPKLPDVILMDLDMPGTDGLTATRLISAGTRMGLKENTVKFHVRNILDKLPLHNRAQVVGFALRHGIVASPEKPASR